MSGDEQRRKEQVDDMGIGPTGPAEADDQGTTPGRGVDEEAMKRGSARGINPQDVESMSRGEDDQRVFEDSPEFSDRPGSKINRESEPKR
jgi:hypothetical protein